MPQHYFKQQQQIGNFISPSPPNTNISEEIKERNADGQEKTTRKFFDDNLLIADLLKGSTDAPEISVGPQRTSPLPFGDQPEVQGGGGFLGGVGKVGDFLAGDVGQDILGQIGQAFTASDPSSPAFQLNKGISERAQGSIKSGLLGKALEGTLTPEDLQGVDPAAAQEAIQTQQGLASSKSLSGQQEAVAGAQIPFQDRLNLEYFKARQVPTGTGGRVTINVGPDGSQTGARNKHIWQVDSQGNPINYIGPNTTPMPSSGDSRLPEFVIGSVDDALVREFMNEFQNNLVNRFSPQELDVNKQLEALRDFTSGKVIPERVFEGLSDPMKKKWVARYEDLVKQYETKGSFQGELGKGFIKKERFEF